MSWFDTILYPLMWVVAWIMYGFHWVLTRLGLESDSGLTWALSIIGLVITIRILLIPLFVRQIKAARGMQLLSPELQALQKKYKGKTDPASREAMTRETMELYRKHGTNPFSSCLPLLAQSPIFLALFRVLSNLRALAEGTFQGGDRTNIGPITQQIAEEANRATIFDAEISSWFLMPNATTATKIVAVALIVLMSVTTFTTQKQLTQKNMPATALQGPMAQQQKMLLYVLPIVFALSGVSFPIGVLIYWSTTNLWSMGQQFYVIRRNPTPGSEAERLLKERRARKAAAKGIVLEEEVAAEPEKPKGQRQQPVRKDRARPRPAGAAGAAGSATSATGAPSTARPAGAKPAAGKTAGGKTGAGTSPASRATASGASAARSGAATSATGGSAAAKAGAGKAAPGKSGASKPGASKPGASKPGASKPGATRSGATKPGASDRGADKAGAPNATGATQKKSSAGSGATSAAGSAVSEPDGSVEPTTAPDAPAPQDEQ